MTDRLRDAVAAICGTLPGAEVSDPWGGGHDAWKVGGKMFACIGTTGDGVSVKCPDVETAEMLKQVGAAVHAPYFHKSWVRIPEDASTDELAHRIAASYDIIRSKLPVAMRRSLPPRDPRG